MKTSLDQELKVMFQNAREVLVNERSGACSETWRRRCSNLPKFQDMLRAMMLGRLTLNALSTKVTITFPMTDQSFLDLEPVTLGPDEYEIVSLVNSLWRERKSIIEEFIDKHSISIFTLAALAVSDKYRAERRAGWITKMEADYTEQTTIPVAKQLFRANTEHLHLYRFEWSNLTLFNFEEKLADKTYQRNGTFASIELGTIVKSYIRGETMLNQRWILPHINPVCNAAKNMTSGSELFFSREPLDHSSGTYPITASIPSIGRMRRGRVKYIANRRVNSPKFVLTDNRWKEIVKLLQAEELINVAT